MTYPHEARLSLGVAGLDEILGGLVPQRTYLAKGGPGTGKTTLGLHFLRAGVPEESLLVSLGESEAEMRNNAERIQLSLKGVPVMDLSPMANDPSAHETYSLLESWEAEGTTIHDRILEQAAQYRPRRVFIDSISTMRYLTPDPFQFRRQVLSLMRTFEQQGATMLLTAQTAEDISDADLLSLSDGVIHFERVTDGRLCRVIKIRGSGFIEGNHHYELTGAGMIVYPRLVPGAHQRPSPPPEALPSGIPGIDSLTHGGIERGTVTILSGPSGTGKTSLGTHFVNHAAQSGERCVLYSFDERFSTFAPRCEGLGLRIHELIERGTLHFDEVEPLRYNPDEFATHVRDEVEHRGTRLVMLDSLSGYRRAMRGEELVDRIHALCRYLANMGVTVIVINEVHSVAGGDFHATEYGISYLADTILLVRYVEVSGELRKCVGVLKKRTGGFEQGLRELIFGDGELDAGRPLANIRGVLEGVPKASSIADTPREFT
ncbi:MAG: ATPase domain-containing protein [Halofilum sp. (in: g-proteobacteria)]